MLCLFKIIQIGCLFFCLAGCALFSPPTEPPSAPIPIRQMFPAFRLLDYQGKAVDLRSFYLKSNPIILFCRSFKKDGPWLLALKAKLKEFYVEGAMIFILYPEGEISLSEVEEARIGAYFLEDLQSLVAKQYRVYDESAGEPYFAIFMGDLASRCLLQQVVRESEKAMTPDLLLQNFRRLRMLPEEKEEEEKEDTALETDKQNKSESQNENNKEEEK